MFLRFSCTLICVPEVTLNPIDSGPDTAQSTQGKRPASKKTTALKTGGALRSHPSHQSPTRGRGGDGVKQKRDHATSPVKSTSDYSSSPEKGSLSSSQGSSTRLLLQCRPVYFLCLILLWLCPDVMVDWVFRIKHLFYFGSLRQPKKGLSFNITMHSCSYSGKCTNHFDTSGHVGVEMCFFVCVVILVFPFY